MDDPRMGLGTDQLEWLPDLLSEMTEQPEPLPWMGWGPLPMMPPQRQASEAAPLALGERGAVDGALGEPDEPARHGLLT